MSRLALPFTTSVESGGYAWWYLDVLGDDGRHAATLIFLVGNPFSPFYLRALGRAARAAPHAPPAVAPERFCAVNAVLYRGRRKLWTFDEVAGCQRDASGVAIAGGSLRREGDALVATVDTRSPLLGARLRGRVRVEPSALFDQRVQLERRGQHRWHPMGPHGHAEVELDSPRLSFRGRAYFDGNHGDEPLARGFRNWYWMRAPTEDGRATEVVYDTVDRDGGPRRLARRFGADGRASELALFEQPTVLPRTRWLIPRATRLHPGERVTGVRTVESAPFYARAVLSLERDGERREAMHELMDLGRFSRPLVQAAFYLRMRRGARADAPRRLGLRTRLLGESESRGDSDE